jgi:hypothetical protein
MLSLSLFRGNKRANKTNSTTVLHNPWQRRYDEPTQKPLRVKESADVLDIIDTTSFRTVEPVVAAQRPPAADSIVSSSVVSEASVLSPVSPQLPSSIPPTPPSKAAKDSPRVDIDFQDEPLNLKDWFPSHFQSNSSSQDMNGRQSSSGGGKKGSSSRLTLSRDAEVSFQNIEIFVK